MHRQLSSRTRGRIDQRATLARPDGTPTDSRAARYPGLRWTALPSPLARGWRQRQLGQGTRTVIGEMSFKRWRNEFQRRETTSRIMSSQYLVDRVHIGVSIEIVRIEDRRRRESSVWVVTCRCNLIHSIHVRIRRRIARLTDRIAPVMHFVLHQARPCARLQSHLQPLLGNWSHRAR